MMRGLPSLLLLMVVLTHYGYAPLASFYAHPDEAGRALFYILRGLEGALLFCVVWALAPREPLWFRYGVSLACAWGAIEEAQTAICRVALGIASAPHTEPYQGLCDLVTGWPIYMITLVVVLLVTTLRHGSATGPR